MKRFFLLLVLVGGVLSIDGTSVAQVAPVPVGTTPSPPPVSVAPATISLPQAPSVPVRILQVTSITNPRTDTLRLNDEVVVRVAGLQQAMAKQNIKAADLRLYVDEILLPIPPTALDTRRRPDTASVRFRLIRNATTESTWQIFYKVPGKYEHPARIGLGVADGQIAIPYPAGNKNVILELIRPRLLLLGLLLVAAMVGYVAWLAFRTGLLRNDWSNQLQREPNEQIPTFDPLYQRVSFSLTKVQLALWTVLILSAYIMIYLVTGEVPILYDSLLGLLGISLANGWLGKIINRDQDKKNASRHQDLPSNGFFTDIVTDERGVSIARLQFIAFNVLAAIYFIRYVLKNWGMPEFDAQLLTLLGVSSLSLMALKTQENPKLVPQTETNPAPTIQGSGAPVPGATPATISPTGNSIRTLANPAPTVDAEGTPSYRADEDDNAALIVPGPAMAAHLVSPSLGDLPPLNRTTLK